MEDHGRDRRRRVVRADNDARHFHELMRRRRHLRDTAAAEPIPLRWAAAHPLFIDTELGGYHRLWCPHIELATGRDLHEGELLPREQSLYACRRCQPDLVLRAA